jgi:hypothetical protein
MIKYKKNKMMNNFQHLIMILKIYIMIKRIINLKLLSKKLLKVINLVLQNHSSID